jgi:tripartite-type tricarboxylate transporter receptor subunit TctC
MKLPRRSFLHLAVSAAGCIALRLDVSLSDPPVRIIVSGAAGTGMDVHGRLYGQWFSERLCQP